MARTIKDFKKKHDPSTVIAGLQEELKTARADQIDAQTIRDWLGATKLETQKLQIPKWAIEPKTAGTPGVPTVQLSDFHWGEMVRPEQIGGVNAFDMVIARRRLQTVIQTAIRLAHILDPKMKYPGIVVQLLGDMISGNIHDELTATNELNTMPTVLDLYKYLVVAITSLADAFGFVFVACVGGNHGRDTKKTWAKDRNHTSFDWLLYQFLSVAFANDARVRFYIPDGSDGLYGIYNTRYLITHGDQFKAGDSIIGPVGPVMRGEQKKLSRNVAVGQEYEVMAFGHWHQRMIWSRGRGNGTLKGFDEYAFQGNFRFEPPSQNFWLTHPDHGITFDAPLFCDESRQRAPAEWVSWRK